MPCVCIILSMHCIVLWIINQIHIISSINQDRYKPHCAMVVSFAICTIVHTVLW